MKGETKLKHARTFYTALIKQSTMVESNKETAMVFKGSLTKVFVTDCGLPLSYYTDVKATLDQFECLQIIERGTRSYDSVVRLVKPPPKADDPQVASFVKSVSVPLTDRAAVAKLRVDVDKLKAWRESQKGLDVLEAASNMEKRIAAIENQLKKLNNNK